MNAAFRYTFRHEIGARDIEETLLLSALACQALYGAAAVRLEAGYELDADRRRCVVSADSEVGRDLNLLFAGLIGQEFGADSFTVEPIGAALDQRLPDRAEHRSPKAPVDLNVPF